MPMHTPDLPWFRELFDEIVKYKRHTLFWDVLTPWIEKSQPAILYLNRWRTFSPVDSTSVFECDAMSNLYALNRVNDLLLRSFQGENNTAYSGPKLTQDEYATFFSHLKNPEAWFAEDQASFQPGAPV